MRQEDRAMADAAIPFRPLSLQGRWRTYTPADGLGALDVEHVVEDHEGCLWFATASGGISRYDGDTFRTFTMRDGLSSDRVLALLCDRRGRLWCGTYDHGVCWYEDGAFGGFAAETWCASGHFSYLLEDRQGRVWFAGGGGVGCWDGTEVRDLSGQYVRAGGRPPGFCWGIAEDRAGCLWLGGHDLVRWDGAQFASFGAESGLDPAAGAIYAVARDGEGLLWVGLGRRLWQRTEDGFAPVSMASGGHIRKLQTDRQGRLWVCRGGGPALVRQGDTFEGLVVDDALARAGTNGMCHDREGQFWFATWGAGVTCLDPHGCHAALGPVGQDAGTVWSLAASGGGVRWGAHRSGSSGAHAVTVGTCAGGSGSAQQLPIEATDWYPPVLAPHGAGSFWIGSRAGLHLSDGTTTTTRVYPPDPDKQGPVSALATDAAGRLFFVCYRMREQVVQLVRCDADQRFTVLADDLGDHVSALLPRADGSLWCGFGPQRMEGSGAGLACVGTDGRLARWTAADGLVDDRVTDLSEDDEGRLWIATLGGVSCMDATGFRSYTRADGLPGHHVLCLCWDSRKRLWLGLQGGLAVYDGCTWQHQWLPEVGSIRDLAEDAEGVLWLGTDQGLRRYVPQGCRPRVQVTRVVADREYERVSEVRFPASVAQVQVEYQGASLRTPRRDLVYRCRLRGHDPEWQRPTRAGQVRYPRLAVGDYVLEVQAVDRDLNYSETAAVRLTVEPDAKLAGLTEALSASGPAGEFVGESAAIRQVLRKLRQAAAVDVTVLILGETGTGKGLAARALHALSERRRAPFIIVSCGALPEGLVESELFGHERGAFTGAVQRKLGKVELAAEGTLFLDEIGDLPLAAQAKLLRLLEEGTFDRVGGTRELAATARIVAATNRDLDQMVAAGSFRQDLYYRLQVLPVHLPPLRERQDDIELLALYFLHRTAAHLHKLDIEGFAPEALAALQRHDWPGNVRELEHVVRRAVIVGNAPQLRAEDVALGPAPARAADSDPIVPLQEHERRYLCRVLEHTGGAIYGPGGAAQLLGLPPATLYSRIKKLGITRP